MPFLSEDGIVGLEAVFLKEGFIALSLDVCGLIDISFRRGMESNRGRLLMSDFCDVAIEFCGRECPKRKYEGSVAS